MNKPEMKFRAGSIACSLWRNDMNVEGRSVSVLKATVDKRFKAADGTWKSTSSLGRNDIPLALYALIRAYAYMLEERNVEDES